MSLSVPAELSSEAAARRPGQAGSSQPAPFQITIRNYSLANAYSVLALGSPLLLCLALLSRLTLPALELLADAMASHFTLYVLLFLLSLPARASLAPQRLRFAEQSSLLDDLPFSLPKRRAGWEAHDVQLYIIQLILQPTRWLTISCGSLTVPEASRPLVPPPSRALSRESRSRYGAQQLETYPTTCADVLPMHTQNLPGSPAQNRHACRSRGSLQGALQSMSNVLSESCDSRGSEQVVLNSAAC